MWSEALGGLDHASLASELVPIGGCCCLADCHSLRRLHPMTGFFRAPPSISIHQENGSGWAAQRWGRRLVLGRLGGPWRRGARSRARPSRAVLRLHGGRWTGTRNKARHGVASNGTPCKGGRRRLGPEATQGAPRSSRQSEVVAVLPIVTHTSTPPPIVPCSAPLHSYPFTRRTARDGQHSDGAGASS
jgi:hypothetical protein